MSVKKQTVGVPVLRPGVLSAASGSAIPFLSLPAAKAHDFGTKERIARRSKGGRPSTVKVELDRPFPEM